MANMACTGTFYILRAGFHRSAEGAISTSISAVKPANSLGGLGSCKMLRSSQGFGKLRVGGHPSRSWTDKNMRVSVSLESVKKLTLQKKEAGVELGPDPALSWYAGVDHITLEDSPLQKHLPIINFAGIHGPERPRIVAQVGRALEEYTFFYAVNHGVNHVEKLERECKEFFELPLEEKDLYLSNPGFRNEGYYNFRVRSTVDNPGFWKEIIRCKTLPLKIRDLTKWPSKVRQVIHDSGMDYAAFCQNVLTIISESLGLPPSYINDSITEPTAAFVPSYYHARDWEKEGQPTPISAIPHTDISMITIIAQEDLPHPALQYLVKGEWVNCRPVPDSLFVLTGDQLEVKIHCSQQMLNFREIVNIVGVLNTGGCFLFNFTIFNKLQKISAYYL
ncbi:hypothetical protein O6H91_04G063100 [Diphasiastrum complanatum]|uniref:Uncharacterized protein n=1 Tax=Diphasiastrum complanatum TaxID=34168 RepID=A0ACC2DXD2_DIPCM|nr:hypothetical protein O6H91_04G063100 [Diphasiastrum complanatum]